MPDPRPENYANLSDAQLAEKIREKWRTHQSRLRTLEEIVQVQTQTLREKDQALKEQAEMVQNLRQQLEQAQQELQARHQLLLWLAGEVNPEAGG